MKKKLTDKFRLRSSSNPASLFNSKKASQGTSTNIDLNNIDEYHPLSIISNPEKYQDKSAAIKYLLILHLDIPRVIEFLLFNEKASSFNFIGHGLYIDSYKIIFLKLASSVVGSLSLTKPTMARAKEIAERLRQTYSATLSTNIKFSAEGNSNALNDFYKSIASGKSRKPPFEDSFLLELKQSFFFLAISESKEFCSLITTNAGFNLLIKQHYSKSLLTEQIDLFSKIFTNLRDIEHEKEFNESFKEILKDILTHYIDHQKENINEVFIELLFHGNIFWKIFDNYSKQDLENLVKKLAEYELTDAAMQQIIKMIDEGKKHNTFKALKSGFLQDLSSHCRPQTRKPFMKAVMRLKDPKLDSLICKPIGYQNIIKHLNKNENNNQNEWESMLERLAGWFTYDSLLADPSKARQVTSNQGLSEGSGEKIANLKQLVFLSSTEATKLMLMLKGNQLSTIKDEWISAHRCVVNIISTQFSSHVKDNLGEIGELHQAYDRVLIRKLVNQDADRFESSHYCPSNLPDKIQQCLSDLDKAKIEQQLAIMDSKSQEMEKINARFNECAQVEGFSSLHSVLVSVIDEKKIETNSIKKLEDEFLNILAKISNYPSEALEQDRMKNLKKIKSPAFINDKYVDALKILLKKDVILKSELGSTQLNAKKLTDALKDFFDQLDSSDEQNSHTQISILNK